MTSRQKKTSQFLLYLLKNTNSITNSLEFITHKDRHVKFLKKKCGTTRGKSVIFFKFFFWSSKCFLPSPCLRTSSVPPWETLKCLLQTLQYACCLSRSLAITQSNVLVYSALKFDPLLYCIRFFAGLFAFRHLCWAYQVIQPLGLFVPVLFG